MFAYYLIDVLLAGILLLTLKNYKIGFIVLLFYYILTPGLFKFVIGSVSIPFQILSTICIFVSFLINNQRTLKLPQRIGAYFKVGLLSTLILIFLSSKVVPIKYQLYSFFREDVILSFLFVFVGYFVLLQVDRRVLIKCILICSVIIGIYGLYTYFIHMNPYVSLLSLIYTGQEESAEVFADSLRGGMTGRIYGTMLHPLGWGQLWNLIIPFSFFFKKQVNGYFFWTLQVVGILNCLLSGSRSALICLAISYFFYFVIGGWQAMVKKSFLAVLIMIFTTAFIVPSNSQLGKYINSTIYFWDDSYIDAAKIDGSNSEMRLMQLYAAIDIANANMAGLGYNFQLYELEDSRVYISSLLGLESVFFKKLVEQGYLGIIIWFYLLFQLFLEIKSKIPSKRNYLKPLIYGYFLSYIVSMFITGQQGVTILVFPVFAFIIYQTIVYDTQGDTLLLVRKEKQTRERTA